MAPRLKVFVTSDGLTDYVVAVSSKPKALAAWGSHQDLFRTGLAHETDDVRLAEAARAQPGQVLKRPAGSRATLEKLKPAQPAKPARPSRAALRRVTALESQLAAADKSHAEALAGIEQRRRDLVREEERLIERYRARRDKLAEALSAARPAPA